jgi:hypothetical protein
MNNVTEVREIAILGEATLKRGNSPVSETQGVKFLIHTLEKFIELINSDV